jgi:hypothetical protein
MPDGFLSKGMPWLLFASVLIAGSFFCYSFGKTRALAEEITPSAQCQYAICIDSEKTGGEDQKPGSIFPMTIMIEPKHELRIKIFGPGVQMIFERSFYSDENGLVRAEYAIPADAKEGYYRVYLSTKAEEGKSYYSILFKIGDPNSGQNDRPFHIGDAEATQNGEHKMTFEADKPVDVLYRFGSPQVNVPANVPVNIVLYSESNAILDNATIYTISDDGSTIAHYIFTPMEYGDYRAVARVMYGGFSSEYAFPLKVRASSEYNFEVEGKKAAVTVDRYGDIGKVKSVNLDVAAKKLDIEIANEREYNILEVLVPYELLGDPYTVLTDGETVNLGKTSLSGNISKDQTFAAVRIPLDDSVSHIEIIGTSVIPEFPLAVPVLATGIVSLFVFFRLQASGKKYRQPD